MTDLVVTCLKTFWHSWLAEGDPAGAPESGEEWLYVVAHGKLREWAPVTHLMRTDTGWGICRRGGAVACTIPEPVPGFRGYRRRWWEREAEAPFPDWRRP